MRELCQELGISLIVPTICRHCGRQIYLYANPDGGFAIFDDLGKPWPKHLCGLIRATTREYYSVNVIFSPKHRIPVPDQIVEGTPQSSQPFCGTVVATEGRRVEVFDGRHRYWVTPSRALRLGQAVKGKIQFTGNQVILEIDDVPVPMREDLAESQRRATAAEGEVMNVAAHNRNTTLVGRLLRKKLKVVWGVFSKTNQLVAIYEYAHRNEAEAYAAQLTEERRTTYYVQQFREIMR